VRVVRGPHPAKLAHSWTADNLLRRTVYVRLREDKPAGCGAQPPLRAGQAGGGVLEDRDGRDS
jgi:hypothetical protein